MGEAKRRKERGVYPRLTSRRIPSGPFPLTSRRIPPGPFPLEARRVFMLEGCEPITPQLAEELTRPGRWDAYAVEEARELGAVYCRPRDSFLFPEDPGTLEFAREDGDPVVHFHWLRW